MIKNIVGQVFESLKEYALIAFRATVDESFFLALIIALILLLFIIAGSSRAKKYLYWTIFVYLILEFSKAAIHA